MRGVRPGASGEFSFFNSKNIRGHNYSKECCDGGKGEMSLSQSPSAHPIHSLVSPLR